MPTIKDGKLLYHQTALENLESIINYGLLSRSEMDLRHKPFKDVADPNIILERKNNGLENYVPFHFHPRTAFDYRIRYDHKKEKFIYICVRRDYAKSVNALVLPAHPLSNERPKLYNYEEGMSHIDWETMEKTQEQEGYNPQVRMAECLFKKTVQASHFFSICVKDDECQTYVKSILTEFNLHNIHVDVKKYF